MFFGCEAFFDAFSAASSFFLSSAFSFSRFIASSFFLSSAFSFSRSDAVAFVALSATGAAAVAPVHSSQPLQRTRLFHRHFSCQSPAYV